MSPRLRRSLLIAGTSPLLLYLARTHRFADAPSVGGGAPTHSVGKALVVFLAAAALVLGTWLAVVALREYFRDDEPMGGALLATVIVEGWALAAVRAYIYAGPDAGTVAHGARASGKGTAILALFVTMGVLAGAAERARATG